MARKKRQTRWVIYASPKPRSGPGTRYYAEDGSVTQRASKAAKFFTGESAIEFAERKGIKLDGAMSYVGQEDFNDFDLRDE
ncbi:MAG: hypothetical protein DMD76_18655 [Candidatus Rokuibacteriota bacterium]|nr:MAG: hypothetical protein DMD76_18655 [Candidatus Rokubacteria bacterium]